MKLSLSLVSLVILSTLFLLVLPAKLVAKCPTTCPDPTADDIRVQAQLNALSAAGGGTLQLDPRVYQTCQAWIVGSNTQLRGAGRGATIIRGGPQFTGKTVNNAFATGTISTVGTTKVTVSDVTVDHRTCNRSANGVAIFPAGIPGEDQQLYNGTLASNVLIKNVEVLGAQGFHNYMIWNLKGQHVKIIGNWVDGGTDPRSSYAQQEGIESFGGHDVLISGNTVRNIGYACLNVGSAGLPNSGTDSIVMTDNYLSNCYVGVNLGTSLTPDLAPQNQTSTRVTNNVIINQRFAGIDVGVFKGTVEKDLLIAHNTIRDINASGAVGIRLRSVGSSPVGSESVVANTISGNYIGNIRGTNAHGIRLNSYHNVRIAGNMIVGVDHGAIFAVNSNDVEVVANRLGKIGIAAVQLHGKADGGFKRFTVERNSIDWQGTASAVLVLNGRDGTVKYNAIKRYDALQPTPITVTNGSCGVTVAGNAAWYHRMWNGLTLPKCP